MRKDAVYCSARCNSAAHQATRKARMKITVDGEVTRIPRAYIIDRDGSRCHMCKRKCSGTNLHIDHVIPLSRGGTHTLENLRVACATCNMSKRADARGEQLMLIG
jgi:5-methylcytosine-specific restriction endonuclease McrA